MKPSPLRTVSVVKENSVAGFAQCWAVYPNKSKKAYAEKCWHRLKPSTELSHLIFRSIRMKMGREWKGRASRYIPHFSTFINQKEFEDYMAELETDETETTPQILDHHVHTCRFCKAEHDWIHEDGLCFADEHLACTEFRRKVKGQA